MRITQEGDYALRVVLYLCNLGMGEKIEAKHIAVHEKIPLRFLLKLLRKLVHGGIVRSFRGVGGGYSIAQEPKNITLKNVIEAIEGPIYVNRCLYDKDFCNLNRTGSCDVHRALNQVQSNLISDLDSITFEKIMKNEL
ncbi:MAG: Rrf2 family transcriptional regulator [Thermotaleaceae bacterium]